VFGLGGDARAGLEFDALSAVDRALTIANLRADARAIASVLAPSAQRVRLELDDSMRDNCVLLCRDDLTR
jgi:hypothetical protein